jgi:hypothetical protein
MEEFAKFKEQSLQTTLEHIQSCKYCTEIVTHSIRTPVLCTKYAGSSVPISVNLVTCITCGEYKQG